MEQSSQEYQENERLAEKVSNDGAQAFYNAEHSDVDAKREMWKRVAEEYKRCHIDVDHALIASPEYQEYERMMIKASHDEAQAIYNAERRATETERKKWIGVAKENEKVKKENEKVKKENEALKAEREQLRRSLETG